jgi:hypothetical protein
MHSMLRLYFKTSYKSPNCVPETGLIFGAKFQGQRLKTLNLGNINFLRPISLFFTEL